MELCVDQSLRRIDDFSEMGFVQTAKAETKEQKIKAQAASIGSYFKLFYRKYKIERVGLPEIDKLTDCQASELANALENAFNALGKYVAFPNNLPMNLRYAFLRDLWLDDSKALYYTQKIIEPCREHELGCPYKGYCKLCEIYDEDID